MLRKTAITTAFEVSSLSASKKPKPPVEGLKQRLNYSDMHIPRYH
jgi:hypothetical protein